MVLFARCIGDGCFKIIIVDYNTFLPDDNFFNSMTENCCSFADREDKI